jgi:hypothetical protein
MSENIHYRGYNIQTITETLGLKGRTITPYKSFVVKGAKVVGSESFAPLYRTTRGGYPKSAALRDIKNDIDWYQKQGWIA